MHIARVTNLLFRSASFIKKINSYCRKALKCGIGIILINSISPLYAQVTIGSSIKPNTGVVLDLKQEKSVDGEANATKGLLLPRVSLTTLKPAIGKLSESIGGTGNWDEIRHTGLTVYNVNAGDACNVGVGIGVYMWTGETWTSVGRGSSKSNSPSQIVSTDKYKGANSYIIKKGNQTIEFPIERGYKIWRDHVGSDAINGKVLSLADINNLTGTLAVETVWQEAEDGSATDVIATPSLIGADETAKIKIVSGTKTGNALVRVTIDTKTLWQWHIWVTEDDPNTKTYHYNNSKKDYWFMDRYLGAGTNAQSSAANGLYYQWGRPTPMKKKGTISTLSMATNASEKKNLTTAIQSESFITYINANSHDWYSTSANQWNGRWGNQNENLATTKTAFDPCPEGWRVPSGVEDLSPWNCLIAPTGQSFNNGYNFNSTNQTIGYYPAAGYRSNGDGSLGDVGTAAFVWTASDSDKKVHFLKFNASNVKPWFQYNKANAMSVRCALETK